ncbi:MAG TPA: aldehyde dehydrogenase family protein, partial [Gemmatimonadaceae bacterium]|nr:aldehyde dehydrogenase family protein [Gemmatimonadaceae bacterium]
MSHSLYIDGRFTDSRSDRTVDVIDPATQDIIARVPDGDASDVDAAVGAARRAFESGPWRDVTAQERGRILFRL